jgi:hypothetical protein
LANLSKSRLDTSYVQVPIQAILNGESYDPTNDPVVLAFMANWALPGSSDWNGGSWSDSTAPGIFLAQCLVGPANSGVALDQGTYTIWVKITDNPEVPVINAGTLTIT